MGANFSAKSNELLRIQIGGIIGVKCKRLNKVKTTKYTWLTFIPLNFYEQFRRAVYFYFLVITIISFFVNTTLSPLTSLLPLLFVMIVTAIKEGHEDYLRFKNDKIINTTKVTVLREGKECQIPSEYLNPGDLVVIYRDCDVPCDSILLTSTDVHGKCFINTVNLDGESNLKTVSVPHGMPNSSDICLDKLGDIICEQPTSDLYNFNGRIELQQMHASQVLPLTVQNLLLRGTRIKNTERVVACAIYTGMSTKLQLNSRYTGNKSASSELYINKYILVLIFGMLICVAILFIMERVYIEILVDNPYIGPVDYNSAMQMITDFLAFLILFNYMVPISMYMNIELYRVFGAYFMRSDIDLYDEQTDQPCTVNTSNLNEDLGQINIIFSDKTGTLTKNEMKFVECSINATQYHLRDKSLNNVLTSQSVLPEHFDVDHIAFFEALSICHTVEVIPSKTIDSTDSCSQKDTFDKAASANCYQASSPDEKALLEACANIGIIFAGYIDNDVMCVRYPHGSNIQKNTKQSSLKHYKRLCLLEFSSDRKRMSVIVRDENESIWIYSKGAESSIFPLCSDRSSAQISKTDAHITEFAKKGLRTLAIGRRILTEKEYKSFISMYNTANSALENRQQLIDESFATVENELHLLGATAVEDALQDNVAQTLGALQDAGIKIWVLTGDKVETALNIGLACKHVPANANIHFIVNMTDSEEILKQLKSFEFSFKNSTRNENALVIDGESLAIILNIARDQFRNIALLCKSVLCCRLSPLQKSEIVTLIKKTHKYLTAAVGDGANDVSMIQEAHVGIAIMGKEGSQAARCADYAIAKFDMLRRLLLVHGHYNTTRLAFLVLFYCYKNVVITGCMVLYQIYDLFSATSVYSSLYLWLFDILYISFSFTYLAISDKAYNEDVLLRCPTLYKRNTHNKQASWSTFGIWMLNAFLHTFVIFYFAYFTIGINDVLLNSGQTADFYCFGTMLIQLVIVVGNLKLLLIAHYMSYVNIGFICFGIGSFMLSTFIANVASINELYWVYNMFVSSLPMWLYTFVTIVACLFTDLIVKVFHEIYSRSPSTVSDGKLEDQSYRRISI